MVKRRTWIRDVLGRFSGNGAGAGKRRRPRITTPRRVANSPAVRAETRKADARNAAIVERHLKATGGLSERDRKIIARVKRG